MFCCYAVVILRKPVLRRRQRDMRLHASVKIGGCLELRHPTTIEIKGNRSRGPEAPEMTDEACELSEEAEVVAVLQSGMLPGCAAQPQSVVSSWASPSTSQLLDQVR